MTTYFTTLTLLNDAAAGNGNPISWPGGYGQFAAVFTGVGSVTLQTLLPDGTTWANVGSAVTLAASGTLGGFMLPPSQIRAVGAGGSAISAWATPIQTPVVTAN